MSTCPKKNALNSLWSTALTVGRWFSFLSAVSSGEIKADHLG